MKARLSTFLRIVATAIECCIIAIGIAFAIVAAVHGVDNGLSSGCRSVDASLISK